MVVHARGLLCKLFMRKNQNNFSPQNEGMAQAIEGNNQGATINIYTQTHTHSIVIRFFVLKRLKCKVVGYIEVSIYQLLYQYMTRESKVGTLRRLFPQHLLELNHNWFEWNLRYKYTNKQMISLHDKSSHLILMEKRIIP